MGSAQSASAGIFSPLVGKKEMTIGIPFLSTEEGDQGEVFLRLLNVGKISESYIYWSRIFTAKLENITFNSFVYNGNGEKHRMLFGRYYLQNCPGIVFVMDSRDGRAQSPDYEPNYETEMFHDFMELLKPSCDYILVLADNGLSVDKIYQLLDLDRYRSKKWHVRKVCLSSGEGVMEGLKWLVANIASGMIEQNRT